MLIKIKKMIRSNLFSNVSWTVASKVIAMVAFMLNDIIIARMLSVESYGEWSYFFSIISILYWIGQFGLNASSRVFLARYDNDSDFSDITLYTSYKLRKVISLLITILYLFLVNTIAYYCGYPDKYPNLLVLLYAGSLLLLLNSFAEYFKEISIGAKNFKTLCMLTFLENFGNLFLSIACILIVGKTATSIELGYILAYLLVCFIGWKIYIKRRMKGKKKLVSKEIALNILRYSLPILLTSIGSLVLLEMDTLMIGMMCTGAEVASYAIPKKLCSKAVHISIALSSSTIPLIANINKDNIVQQKNRFVKIIKLNTYITIMISFCIFILGPVMVKIIYGEQYLEAGRILRFMTGYFFLFSISTPFSIFLEYQKMAGSKVWDFIIMALLNLVLNYLLIPFFGSFGATLATTISMVPYTISMICKSVRVLKKHIVIKDEGGDEHASFENKV